VSAEPEAYPAFESLDRIAIVEMRPPTSPSGILEPFYKLARAGSAEPLTYQIAAAVLSRELGDVLIVTGLVDSVRFPCGEIDGPIGSLALARALTMLGHRVTIVVDEEAIAPIRAVADVACIDIDLRTGGFGDASAARDFGAAFGIVFAVEKLGRNSIGGRHLVWGTPVTVGDPFADDYVLGAAAAGALTVGVGDNGNEIGFGNIRTEAEPLTPAGVHVDGGFFAATAVDHLLPASVSNFGCYAIAAALAVAGRRPELALDGATVRQWTETGLDAGLRSGGVDDVAFRGDDGIPVPFVAATADMFAGIVHQASLGDAWVATASA
jgi:D-glutamate cyclase